MFYRSGWLRCVLVISIGLGLKYVLGSGLTYGIILLYIIYYTIIIHIHYTILILSYTILFSSVPFFFLFLSSQYPSPPLILYYTLPSIPSQSSSFLPLPFLSLISSSFPSSSIPIPIFILYVSGLPSPYLYSSSIQSFQ